LWEARLATQAPEIDGVCYISDPGEIPPRFGEIRRMRITEAHDYDLVGTLVDEPETLAAVLKPELFPIIRAETPRVVTQHR
jgi:ribosomal protein S12 methylthiotransferase